MFVFLAISLSALQLLVLAGLGYYYLLLLAVVVHRESGSGRGPRRQKRPRFAVLIPAHNEASVLPRTLHQLRRQTYPQTGFDVYVVADYCEDDTATVSRECGATVLERDVGPRGRKAYALRWGLAQLLDSPVSYDAFVIFDADSLVHPHFLEVMAQSLDADHQILQGQHIIRHPECGPFGRIATIDMRLNNLFRNQAKAVLGLSCRLMGDGMCFSAEIVRRYGWPTESLGEDREFGIFLVSQGYRVSYVPDAITYGQAAPSWRSASQQRLRWYGGVVETRRRLAARMLTYALRDRNLAALDQAIEIIVPSLTTLAGLSMVLLIVQWLWFPHSVLVPLPLWIGSVLLWLALPFWGLLAAHAPKRELRGLLYLPVYAVWRIWIGTRALILGKRVAWVRTERHKEA